jgi:hypothetical protein
MSKKLESLLIVHKVWIASIRPIGCKYGKCICLLEFCGEFPRPQNDIPNYEMEDHGHALDMENEHQPRYKM